MIQPLLNYSKVLPQSARVRQPTILRGVLTSLFWCFAACILIWLLAFLLSALVPMGIVLMPLLCILLVTSPAEAARRVRHQRGMVVLGYLQQATQLNLPLTAMLASAVLSERGTTRKRLHELNELVQLGLPIHHSLQLAVPELSDRAIGLIAAAEASGTLPQTLQRLLDENRRPSGVDPANAAFYRAYPLALSLIVMVVLTVFMIFVFPKYDQMFMDFHVQLPAITLFVMHFGRSLMLPLTFALMLATFMLVARSVERFFMVRSGFHGLFRGVTDRILWLTPLAHQTARDQGWADVFQSMGDATLNGQSLTRAASMASGLHVNVVLTRRIDRWHRAMEAGATPGEGARQAGLPPIAVGLLSTARAGDDASSVLNFLARYYRSRFSRTQALIRGAVTPVIAVVMGICVGGVAMAMFLPLHRLIDAIAPLSNG